MSFIRKPHLRMPFGKSENSVIELGDVLGTRGKPKVTTKYLDVDDEESTHQPNLLILHDTGGTPNSDWLPWLRNQVAWRGWEVTAPQLPDSDYPDLDAYWEVLKTYEYNDRTVIVGHGSGAVAAFGAVHKLAPNRRIRSIISVAGFYADPGGVNEGLFTEEYDWRKIRRQVRRVGLLCSTDDPYVSEEQTEVLSKQLEVEPMLFDDAGHFDVQSNQRFRSFPEVKELVFAS